MYRQLKENVLVPDFFLTNSHAKTTFAYNDAAVIIFFCKRYKCFKVTLL